MISLLSKKLKNATIEQFFTSPYVVPSIFIDESLVHQVIIYADTLLLSSLGPIV